MAAYERAVGNVPAFRERAGQRAMAQEVARALATAQLGETGEAPVRSIAVVQAGTGVGKSAAYLLVGAAIAMARKTRLMVSTSSVALQEQLIGKDLPMLAATMDPAPKFALAKGRGRYICRTRLASRVGGADESIDAGEDAAAVSAAQPEAAVVFYRSMAQALEQQTWDGDRDSLAEPAPPNLWESVAADRHTCTGKSCPQYQACPYFAARRRLAEADVLVVNHDLLLSSIGTRLLPELDNCLLVLDEAHALPQTAAEQFACELDLSRLRWLDRATLTVVTGMRQLAQKVDRPVDKIVRELRAALQDSGQITFDNLASGMREKDGVRRLKEQEIDALLREPLRMAQARATELLEVCTTLGQAARGAIQEAGGMAPPTLASMYADLGALAGRLSRVKQAADMLLADGEDARTTAKWVSVDARAGRMVAVRLHASPILPGDLLRLNLWGRVAVVGRHHLAHEVFVFPIQACRRFGAEHARNEQHALPGPAVDLVALGGLEQLVAGAAPIPGPGGVPAAQGGGFPQQIGEGAHAHELCTFRCLLAWARHEEADALLLRRGVRAGRRRGGRSRSDGSLLEQLVSKEGAFAVVQRSLFGPHSKVRLPRARADLQLQLRGAAAA